MVSTWALGPALSSSTVNRMGDLAMRFARRLAAAGVASLLDADLSDCEGFVWATTRRRQTPALATIHLRRTTLRTLYRTLEALGTEVLDPRSTLELPPKSRRGTRALSDDEMTLLRTTALGRRRQSLRAAALVALIESTASDPVTNGTEFSCRGLTDVSHATTSAPRRRTSASFTSEP